MKGGPNVSVINKRTCWTRIIKGLTYIQRLEGGDVRSIDLAFQDPTVVPGLKGGFSLVALSQGPRDTLQAGFVQTSVPTPPLTLDSKERKPILHLSKHPPCSHEVSTLNLVMKRLRVRSVGVPETLIFLGGRVPHSRWARELRKEPRASCRGSDSRRFLNNSETSKLQE